MPDTLAWIIAGGLLMSAIAKVGGVIVFMKPATLERILLPLVSLAAETAWLVADFSAFLLLEQLLHWHHSHSAREARRQPVTYLILLGDGIHNFIGGLAIASTFLIAPCAGISAWIAAVAHEVPQELGTSACWYTAADRGGAH